MDILGFIVVVFTLVSQWPWVANALRTVPQFTLQARRGLFEAYLPIQSWLVDVFHAVAIALIILEAGIFTALAFVAEAPFKGWMTAMLVVMSVVTIGQYVLARVNYVAGRITSRVVSIETDDGSSFDMEEKHFACAKQVETLWPGLPMNEVAEKARPFTWLALVSVAFLLQGFVVQQHAVMYESLFNAQILIVVGIISKLVYAFAAVIVAGVIGTIIRKGTKGIEFISTVAAQLGIGALPGFTIKEALDGKKVDFLDEEYLATAQDFILTAPFLTLMVYDLFILYAPLPIVSYVVGLTIVGQALLSWRHMRSGGPDGAKEVTEDSRRSSFLYYKVGGWLAPCALVIGALLEATDTGRRLMNTARDFWYGVSFIAYRPWYEYLIAIVSLSVTAYACYRLRSWARAPERLAEEKRFSLFFNGLNYLCIIGLVAASAGAKASVVLTVLSVMEKPSIRLAAKILKPEAGAVGIQNPVVRHVGHQDAVQFETKQPAAGIVEIMDHRTAMFSSIAPLVMTSSMDGKQHFVVLPDTDKNLRYRIVMRNADRTSPFWGAVEIVEDPRFVIGSAQGVTSAPETQTASAAPAAAATTEKHGSNTKASKGGKAKFPRASQPADDDIPDVPPLVVLPEFEPR